MKAKVFVFLIFTFIFFLELPSLVKPGTICCYDVSCSNKNPNDCYCSSGNYCPDTNVNTCGSCQCTPGDTRSCNYCSSTSCPQGGTKYCTGGSQTCLDTWQWGSCSGGSCSCTPGQCNVPTTTTTTTTTTTSTTSTTTTTTLPSCSDGKVLVGVNVRYAYAPPTPHYKVDGTQYEAGSVGKSFCWDINSVHTISLVGDISCDDPPSGECGGNKAIIDCEYPHYFCNHQLGGNCLEVLESSCQACNNCYIKVKVKGSGGAVEMDYLPDCCNDAGCGGYAAYCDTTDNTCKCYPSCTSNSRCAAGYCCVYEIDSSKTNCVGKGVYSGNPKYLCDPPGWVNIKNQQINKKAKPTIFELIFNFFNLFFHR